MKNHRMGRIFVLFLILSLASCATPGRRLLDSDSETSQVELRSIQTRTFATADRVRTLRTVMATLQDLGFVIDEADAFLGSVSATKLEGWELRITVLIKPEKGARMLVRANCQFGTRPVNDPEPYQRFFAALEKGMFLDRSGAGEVGYSAVPGSGSAVTAVNAAGVEVSRPMRPAAATVRDVRTEVSRQEKPEVDTSIQMPVEE